MQKMQETEEKKDGNIKHSLLFPESPLFMRWGRNLSHEEQREAQDAFNEYGYNSYLSDRLPNNRSLPDTRDPK